MTNTKNNLPVYVEEKIINEKQVALNKQKVIPQDFVELTSYGESSSTAEFPKTLCWHHNFAYENGKKWVILDISQKLMEKLGLETGKNCSDLVFISPEVLERKPECGGITLQNEKEIFLASPDSKLVREKATQTKSNIKEFTELEKELKELNTKYNQLRSETSTILYPEATIPALAILDEHLIAQAQEVINKLNNLRGERNQAVNQNQNLQQNIINLQGQITQLTNQINNLNQQLIDLTSEKDDYQDKWDGAEEELKQKQEIIRVHLRKIEELERGKKQELNQKDNKITGLRNEIREIERERDDIRVQRDNRPNITLSQWNKDYSRRPTQQQLNNLQTELNNIKTEWDDCCNRWNNHHCPTLTCNLNHCGRNCCECFCFNCREYVINTRL